MDPQSAWEEMLTEIAAGDYHEAELRAEGLMEWLNQDGFPPQTVYRVLSDEWDRMICRYVCRKLMMIANSEGDHL